MESKQRVTLRLVTVIEFLADDLDNWITDLDVRFLFVKLILRTEPHPRTEKYLLEPPKEHLSPLKAGV